jgi:hypothetical protein
MDSTPASIGSWCFWQGPEAGDAGFHLGCVQEAVHQVGDLGELPFAAAHGNQMACLL